MAQKQINDLTLRSDFDGTVNLAVDDATQTYRCTGAQLLTYVQGDAAIITGKTADTAPQSVDSVLTYDSSATAMKKVTLANIKKLRVVAKTTTYTADPEDDVITVSAAADWTLTLPTAVGISGKEYMIIRTDNDITKKVTVDGNASETIGGAADLKLYTLNERLKIVSDGANWQILVHDCATNAEAYTPSLAGVGTPTGVSFVWWRRNDRLHVRGYATTGTVAAAAFSCSIPTGAIMDTAKMSGAKKNMLGILTCLRASGQAFANTTGGPFPVVDDVGTSQTLVYLAGNAASATQFENTLGNAGMVTGNSFAMEFSVPVSGWSA